MSHNMYYVKRREKHSVNVIGKLHSKRINRINLKEGCPMNATGKGTGKRIPKKSFYWYKNVIESNGDCLRDDA